MLGASLDDLIDEDRRLFYVAITRAKSELVLVSEKGAESPFLKNLLKLAALLVWSDYPPSIGVANQFVLRVCNRPGCRIPNDAGGYDAPTYFLREPLRLAGFRFRSSASQKYWERVVASCEVDLEALLSEGWARDAQGVEVILLDGSDTVLRKWSIDLGAATPLACKPLP